MEVLARGAPLIVRIAAHGIALALMTDAGNSSAKKYLKNQKKKLKRKIAALQHGLAKVSGQTLNINSPKQMIAYFYGILQIKPYINRVTNRPKCDAVALTRIDKKGGKRTGRTQHNKQGNNGHKPVQGMDGKKFIKGLHESGHKTDLILGHHKGNG